jgi:hypothetical protein
MRYANHRKQLHLPHLELGEKRIEITISYNHRSTETFKKIKSTLTGWLQEISILIPYYHYILEIALWHDTNRSTKTHDINSRT